MKFVFACGGTGGHIFPAFAVAEELKKRDPSVEVLYVCGKLDIENKIFKGISREKVFSIESAPFRGVLSLLSLNFLIKLIKGFVQAAACLKKERPDLVAGFGGYFSFPVVCAAKFMGIRTLVHEQNVVPGVANRFLSFWTDGTALSFAETESYLRGRHKSVLTGNPVRSSIETDRRAEAMVFFGFERNKKTILVLGGSQGAESINTFFLQALGFFDEALKQKLQVLHLCGRMNPEAALEGYRQAGIAARAFSFFDRMDLAYSVADLAVGRAGATFLAEISLKQIPAVLIPYPFGSGHQLLNAQSHSRSHRAVVMLQKDLTAEKLAVVVKDSVLEAELDKEPRVPRKDKNAREVLADFILETAGMA